MTQNLSYSIPRIAYFAPNIYGVSGYSLIAPLLLLFEKVIISNPTYAYIDQCSRDENHEVTALTSDEFFTYIINGCIVPTGFETFFDENNRNKYYEKFPLLRPSSSFDEDLMKSSLESKIQKLSNNYKLSISPQKAIKFVAQKDTFKNRIDQLRYNKQLPKRYQDFYNDPSSIPIEIRKIAEYKNIDDIIELTALAAYYDFLNNNYAAYCYHQKYNQNVLHIQDTDNTQVYESICEWSGLKNDPNAYIPLLISKSLKTCTNHIPKGKKWRLTPEKINYFRKEYQEEFMNNISSLILEICHKQKGLKPRLDAVHDQLNRKFEILKQHLDSEMIGILKKIIPTVSLLPVSMIQNTKIVQSAMYRGQKPFNVFDQCLYEFLTDPIHYK